MDLDLRKCILQAHWSAYAPEHGVPPLSLCRLWVLLTVSSIHPNRLPQKWLVSAVASLTWMLGWLLPSHLRAAHAVHRGLVSQHLAATHLPLRVSHLRWLVHFAQW